MGHFILEINKFWHGGGLHHVCGKNMVVCLKGYLVSAFRWYGSSSGIGFPGCWQNITGVCLCVCVICHIWCLDVFGSRLGFAVGLLCLLFVEKCFHDFCDAMRLWFGFILLHLMFVLSRSISVHVSRRSVILWLLQCSVMFEFMEVPSVCRIIRCCFTKLSVVC